MRLNVLIGQTILDHQDCLLNIITGVRIGKEKTFTQQHPILLRGHQCQFHMLHIPLVLIVIHHGGGMIHGHILLPILDHIMWSMQCQENHHVQDNYIM